MHTYIYIFISPSIYIYIFVIWWIYICGEYIFVIWWVYDGAGRQTRLTLCQVAAHCLCHQGFPAEHTCCLSSARLQSFPMFWHSNGQYPEGKHIYVRLHFRLLAYCSLLSVWTLNNRRWPRPLPQSQLFVANYLPGYLGPWPFQLENCVSNHPMLVELSY